MTDSRPWPADCAEIGPMDHGTYPGLQHLRQHESRMHGGMTLRGILNLHATCLAAVMATACCARRWAHQ